MLCKPRPLGPSIASDTGPSTLNPHNAYLEILVAFGYIGVTIFASLPGVLANHPGQRYLPVQSSSKASL